MYLSNPGPVEKNLLSKISEKHCLLAILLDPDKLNESSAGVLAKQIEEGGADVILIGGSIGVGYRLDSLIKEIKFNTSLPVILFPGNVDGVAPSADAILFMSALNSRDPYWIIGAQALGAVLVYRAGLEAIPTAYLIVEPGGSSAAGWVCDARPIPREKPEIAVAYSLAAKYLGMRWVYLEAGSGAKEPVPNEMVYAVKKYASLNLIVGGGIRSPEEAASKAAAGADMIVVGTHVEKAEDVKSKVSNIKAGIEKGALLRVKK